MLYFGSGTPLDSHVMVTLSPTLTVFGVNLMFVLLGLAAKKQNIFVTDENGQTAAP